MGGVVTRLAAKNARKKGTKVLYTAHGFHFYKGAPLKNWLFYYPVEKYLSKYTNCIITINEEDFELAKSKFKTAEIEKIDGVGVDLKRFKPVTMKEKENLKKQYGFSKKDFILIYVAEFTDGKNHKFIIKTLNEIKKAIPTLKVIFAGDGKNLKHDKKLVRELCLSETVLFKGYRMDVDKLYQLSDILISSSVREGLPINIIEGMATGLPIVCANIRGQVDVIINGINGYLYNLDDDNKFISSIIELYNDQNKRKKIGENNISYVEKYSLKNAIKNMERIYNKYL